jgi:DNA-binding CsgD family transcriptional regulator
MHDGKNRLLQLILPHIQKALELRQVLEMTQQRLSAGAGYSGSQLDRNVSAKPERGRSRQQLKRKGLLEERRGLAMSGNVLMAEEMANQRKFRKLLLKATSISHVTSQQPLIHALAFSPSAHHGPLHLLATALPHKHSLTTGAQILLLVTDPGASVTFPDDILLNFYGLTSAESEIANGLLMGYSLIEVASLRLITVGTVRQQTKSILAKAGVGSQSELIRLIMSQPRSTVLGS